MTVVPRELPDVVRAIRVVARARTALLREVPDVLRENLAIPSLRSGFLRATRAVPRARTALPRGTLAVLRVRSIRIRGILAVLRVRSIGIRKNPAVLRAVRAVLHVRRPLICENPAALRGDSPLPRVTSVVLGPDAYFSALSMIAGTCASAWSRSNSSSSCWDDSFAATSASAPSLSRNFPSPRHACIALRCTSTYAS
jgi:hypothetical protein